MGTSDRFTYLSATTLDQTFLDSAHDDLTNQLELIVDIESATGTIRASDRNKYVGSTFYEALLTFPVVRRIIGEWLVSELEFSSLDLQLSNVDGRFNNILPGGAEYDGWIGRTITVKLGLRDVDSTYKTIFRGKVTDIGGFGRDIRAIRLIARDDYDQVNVEFPQTVFTRDGFPAIEDGLVGKGVPVIYGDFENDVTAGGASVPAFITNGRHPFVSDEPRTCTLSPHTVTSTRHLLVDGDKIQLETTGALPVALSTGTTYYVRDSATNTFALAATLGGSVVTFSGSGTGTHSIIPDPSQARVAVALAVCDNEPDSLSSVYLRRGDVWTLIPATELTIAGDMRTLTVAQNTATLWLDAAAYLYARGDEFFVKMIGKDLGSDTSNAVAIAKDLLKEYGGLIDADFDSSWATYALKFTPAQSDVANTKARVWQQDSISVLQVALSLLEQVRLEGFVNRDLVFAISSLHLEDFEAEPSFVIRNWDVVKDSFKPSIDVRNNFNRAKALYNFLPDIGEEAYETPTWRNQDAIDQAGKDISKRLVYPNLTDVDTVQANMKETLRLSSAYIEVIELSLTWRALLLDIGDFVTLNVQIGSAEYENVPCLVREIGYDPDGLKIHVKLWSLQMVPFDGWDPGYNGITGGDAATLTQE